MSDFTRPCECSHCGRKHVVRGTAANPTAETQFMMEFVCACGAPMEVYLPGSVNRASVRFEPDAS